MLFLFIIFLISYSGDRFEGPKDLPWYFDPNDFCWPDPGDFQRKFSGPECDPKCLLARWGQVNWTLTNGQQMMIWKRYFCSSIEIFSFLAIQPFNFSGVSCLQMGSIGVKSATFAGYILKDPHSGGLVVSSYLCSLLGSQSDSKVLQKYVLVLLRRTWCMWWRLQINVTQREKRCS